MLRLAALLTAILAAAPALAQDPLLAFPGNYKRLFENTAVEVLRVHYGPSERVGIHDHSAYPTLYIYLNNSGPVRFEHHEDQLDAVTRPPTTAGAYRLSPGRREHHSVQNLAATPSDFLRVELKRPLGSLQPFRAAPPPDPARDSDRIEVEQPGIRVERILCTQHAGCLVRPGPAPSLLVAISPLSFTARTGRTPGDALQHLDPGAVRWLSGSESGEAVPQAAPAHLLRIYLPQP